MEEDDKGLRVEIDPPDTSYANDLTKCMERGDVDQMSFGFWTIADRWDEIDGEYVRTLMECDIDGGDVSVVTYPAYPDTAAALRSRDAWQAASGGQLPTSNSTLADLQRRQKQAEA
jgi:HK97 family phage prohead protease